MYPTFVGRVCVYIDIWKYKHTCTCVRCAMYLWTYWKHECSAAVRAPILPFKNCVLVPLNSVIRRVYMYVYVQMYVCMYIHVHVC